MSIKEYKYYYDLIINLLRGLDAQKVKAIYFIIEGFLGDS